MKISNENNLFESFRFSFSQTSIFLILTAPFIYAMIIPAVVLDLFTFIYQTVCFPVYGIPKVNRADYISFDRHKLPYLTSIQKVNCAYCSYFNGLISYVREVASRTEQYWCPIKHAIKKKGLHKRHKDFFEYGDERFANHEKH